MGHSDRRRETLYAELAELSEAFGPPGHEEEVAEIFRRRLEGLAACRRDRLGSVVAELPGPGPRIMLAAHLDEVGLLVKAVTAEGYLRCVPLGGIWPPVMLGGAFRIKGRRGEVRGVLGAKPPHFMKEEERRQTPQWEGLYIDAGARTGEDALALGLVPGSPAVPDIQPALLPGTGIIMGKALDDRTGVQAIVETARRMAGEKRPGALLVVGTTQEEIGARGARTAASLLHPDVCLVVEGTPADDFPSFPREQAQGVLGRGPQIRIYDPSMIANRALVELAVSEAEDLKIPYQTAVRDGGGTDGGAVHLHGPGVPTLVVGIPVRYAHGPVGLSSLADLELTVELLAAILRRLDAPTVAAL